MKRLQLLCVFSLLWTSCQTTEDLGRLVPPTVDQDPALPQITVEVAGQRRALHLRTFGDPARPPLFVLHGTYDDIRSYLPLCRSLSEKYFVVIWSQRGCGLSERITEEEFTFDSIVEEIRQVKQRFAPDRPITLFGHSWGGALASLYVSRYPQQVNQLILGEPMFLRGQDMQQVFTQLIDFSYGNAGWNEFGEMNRFLSSGDHDQLDYKAAMMLRSNMVLYFCDRDNSPAYAFWRVGGYIEFVRNKRLGNPQQGFPYDFSVGLEKFTRPVLIIGTTCSSLGFDNQTKLTQPLFPDATVVKIENAGHRYLVEKPAESLAIFRNYLTEFR